MSLLMFFIAFGIFVGSIGLTAVSKSQRGRVWIWLSAISLGALFGVSLVRAPHGYAAAYDWGGVAIISGAALIVAAALFLFRATRLAARLTFTGTMLLILAFAVTWGTSEMLGVVRWR
jgi:hypothetical protein